MSFHGHMAGSPHYCQHSSKACLIAIMSCVLYALYREGNFQFYPFRRVETEAQKVEIPSSSLYMAKLGFILNFFLCSLLIVCICVGIHMYVNTCHGLDLGVRGQL